MNPITALEAALAELRASWVGAASTDSYGSFAELQRSGLVPVGSNLGSMAHQLTAQLTLWAAQVARESGSELGAESLAKQHGYRNATHLVAATLGISTGEAQRLIQVGEATTPRMTLSGDLVPAKHPQVAGAMESGALGVQDAAMIIEMLDRVVFRAGLEETAHAERVLCEQAAGLTLAQLAKLIARAESWLDPDGVEPTEQELRAGRSLKITERGGMVHLVGKFDPETGAPIKVALEGIVNAHYRALQNDELPNEDPRTYTQVTADALSSLCEHALGCSNDMPTDGGSVVVRVSLEDLRAGTGHATIDGIAQPISIATARKLSAASGVIPLVLGGESEILDQGRQKRHFTKAQKLALIERDGGCAMCGLPPSMCHVHHIAWWSRGGKSDLSNGILLCSSCHHRIHDNGWGIHIEDATARSKVWFIPPPHLDPSQIPRLGSRAKFDYVAAA